MQELSRVCVAFTLLRAENKQSLVSYPLQLLANLYNRFGVALKQARKSSTRYLAVSFNEMPLSKFKLGGKKAPIDVVVK